MKDQTRVHRPRHRIARGRAWQCGMLAMLLPMAVGLSANDSTLRWPPSAAGANGTTDALPNRGLYSPHATMARVYPGTGLRVMAPAAGFNVREFEVLAGSLVSDRKVPGLAMAIVHRGQILSARGYGVTDVKQPEAIDAHTVFRLASLSKSFAATTTGLLVNEGRLRWDSRVIDYYPSLQLSDPYAVQQLTVADVLSHRVGIGANAFDRDLEQNAEYATLVQKIAYEPMRCAPGMCYAYQNIAYSLIGDVMHGAGESSYEQLVARRLFRPLGMHDASIGLDGIANSQRWAKPHVRSGSGWTSVFPKPTYYRVAPAAGVNASISDMAKWLIAQSGYRPDVLPPSLLATLHAPLIDTPGELRSSKWRRERLNSAGYGLGWRVYDYAGHRLVYHGGAVQGYRGAIALLPERDLGVVILWNSGSAAPSGLLPTILDRAIGIAPQRWLEGETDSEDTVFAQRTPAAPAAPAAPTASVMPSTTPSQGGGADASTSNATPR